MSQSEGAGEIELYNQWFKLADVDQDGVVSGGEAVQFLSRSGLPQKPTLFKVWQYVAGDRPHLNRQEFYTAMKLVSLAQMNNGVLDDQMALRLVNGLGAHVYPPAMQGLPLPPALARPTGQQPPQQQPAPPRPAAPSAPSPIFQQPGLAPTQYPPLSPEQATAFQTAFSQLDTDGDGYVQGVDCFPAFMRSGLGKQQLKDIWDVVAGNEGYLNRHQFVQCLYLIECSKRGMAIPKQLPPGQFPPVVGGDIGSLMNRPQSDIYSGPLSVPPLVPRATYQPGPSPQVAFQSQVPNFQPVSLAMLPESERKRLEEEREAALKEEAQRKKLEEERLAAAARREFFTQSLADLRMAQSKVNRTVVEASQRLEVEKLEAERMEADYTKAYEEFSIQHARATPLVEALKKVEEEKASLAQKVEALKATVVQLESYDPDWEQKEKGECEELNKEIVALTARKEALQFVAEGVERQRDDMVGHIQSLKSAIESAEGQVATLREQVQQATTNGVKDKDAVVGLLKQVAPVYNSLFDTAKQAMVPLPAEALASMKKEHLSFKYDVYKAAGAADLEAFSDEGFRVVSALAGDDRLATFNSPSLAAAIEESEKKEEEEEEDVVVAEDGVVEAEEDTAAGAEEEDGDGSSFVEVSPTDATEALEAEPTAAETVEEEPPVAEATEAVVEEEAANVATAEAEEVATTTVEEEVATEQPSTTLDTEVTEVATDEVEEAVATSTTVEEEEEGNPFGASFDKMFEQQLSLNQEEPAAAAAAAAVAVATTSKPTTTTSASTSPKKAPAPVEGDANWTSF